MTSPVVGEGDAMKVKLSHQESSDAREHKGASPEDQETLNEPCGHNKAETDCTTPNPTQLLEQIQVRV